MNHKHDGIGRSSFDEVDTEKLFSLLGLQEGSLFLDLGCGRGDYSLAAAEQVGKRGRVYAVDKWDEGIQALKKAVAEREIPNITAIRADLAEKLPLEDRSMDCCLLAGVLHHLLEEQMEARVLGEIGRIMKVKGRLALIEFKKIPGTPGPPIEMRIAPEELRGIIVPYGFEEKSSLEIGAHRYLSLFERV